MAPKFADRPIVVMGQGATAGAALGAIDRMMDNMTKTAVFFSCSLGSGGELPEQQ